MSALRDAPQWPIRVQMLQGEHAGEIVDVAEDGSVTLVRAAAPAPHSDAAFQRLWTKYAALPNYEKAEWTAAFNERWAPGLPTVAQLAAIFCGAPWDGVMHGPAGSGIPCTLCTQRAEYVRARLAGAPPK